MQIGGNVGKDGNRTHRTLLSLLLLSCFPRRQIYVSKLELALSLLRVAVDFRRLIKSKQEVMATGAVLSVLMQILSFLAEILQSDTIKKY